MNAGAPSEPSDAPRAPAAWDGRLETLLWLAALALLVLTYGDARLHPNEPVYLLPSIQVLDPSALAHDGWHATSPFRSYSVLFHLLTAPLWWLSDDPLVVAWLARALAWAWVLAGIRGLARALALPVFAAPLAVALYATGSQGIAAGEWMLKNGEQKVWSYGAVFHALAALARGRTLAMGAWAGLATAFHLLVGGWSAIALGVACLVDRRRLGGLRSLARAGGLAALIAAPVIVAGLAYLTAPADATTPAGPYDAADAATRLVLAADGKHLDPARFLNARRIRELVAVFSATCWLAATVPPRASRRGLTAFFVSIVALFASGLVAAGIGLDRLLTFYPFRVADALAPALFWLLAPTAIVRSLAARRPLAVASRVAAVAVLGVAVAYYATELPRYGLREMRRTLDSWSAEGRAERAERLAIHHAMRANLPEDAIVAAYPCEELIWIYARRGVVAARIRKPANARVVDWAERIDALLGEPSGGRLDWHRCQESRVAFAARSPESFVALRDRFGATHALLDTVRDDLGAYEVLRAGGRSVIRLDTIEAPDRP